MLAASLGKDILNHSPRYLSKSGTTLPQRIQHDSKSRTEAPDNSDDDPCTEPTHAENGAREEERERDQQEHNKRQGELRPRSEAEGLV